MKKLALVILAVIGLSVTSAANAAQYVITYKGTVTSGDNGSSLFGGGDLTNQSFVAQYTLTYPTAGATLSNYGSDSSGRRQYSGVGPNNPVTGSILINGITFDLANYHGFVYKANNEGATDIITAQVDNRLGEYLYNTVYSIHNNIVNSIDFTSPMYYEPQSDDYAYGGFSSGYTVLDLKVTSVSVSSVANSAVPEPATWLMLIFGFGLTGATLRRTRQGKSGSLKQTPLAFA